MNYLPDLESGYTPNTPTTPRDKTMTSHRIVRFDLAHKESNGLGYSAVSTTFQSCIRRRRDRTERPNRADRKSEKADCFWRDCRVFKLWTQKFFRNFSIIPRKQKSDKSEIPVQKGELVHLNQYWKIKFRQLLCLHNLSRIWRALLRLRR